MSWCSPRSGMLRPPLSIVAIVMLLLFGTGWCADSNSVNEGHSARIVDAEQEAAPDGPAPPTLRWRVEVKRQATDRGTSGETTKTTLRLEALPSGPASLLRLDLPFPDEKTSFSGNPFNPRLGDIQVKVNMRPIQAGALPLAGSIEVTFPTADPEELGQGKYQLGPGIETVLPLASFGVGSQIHRLSIEPMVRQVVSAGGDDERNDINYTKLELALRDVWHENYSAKFTVKPVIDWERNGETGAVAELEGALRFHRHWRVLLMLGARLWGAGVPSTYRTRVELTLGTTF